MNEDAGFATLRERSGLTVPEVAELTGYARETVYRWERAELVPRKGVVELIAAQAGARKRSRVGQPLFRFIDLFAGIGGMRLAFEAAGGDCVATCEWNKYSRMTYAANFPVREDHPFYGDIREVTASDAKLRAIPDHDVLVAGFPCQPFSIAGVSKKNALGDAHGFACEAQGTLFFDVAEVLRVKRPKAFLLENVKNLVSHDRGNTFRVIMDVLRGQLGYQFVEHRILDAKGFVPQHRERTIIVGFRADAGFSWDDVRIPQAAEGPRMRSVLHRTDEVPDGHHTIGPKTRVHPKYTLTDHLWTYLKNYADKHRAAGNGFGYGLVGPDSVARTLSARYYKDGSEILVDQGKRKNPRRLTPRECARLMGFDRPGETVFRIPVSDTQAYKQFGNAVVVPVIEAVARAMVPCVQELGEPAPTEPKLPLLRKARARAELTDA